MAFEEFVPYLPLVYLSIGSTVAYFFAKLLLGHSKEISKAKRSVEVQREKKSFETSIEELVDNAPDMYAKVLSEIEYLKQNGATENQIASLQKKGAKAFTKAIKMVKNEKGTYSFKSEILPKEKVNDYLAKK